jgi:hypothetical protein
MAVETLTGTPQSFTAGDTVIFTESFSDFPVSTWVGTFVVSVDGNPLSTTGTTSGDLFLFSLSSTVTSGITPGRHLFAHHVTSGGQRATAKTGTIEVMPNIAAQILPTFAQTQVTLLEACVTKLNKSPNVSVNFGGQTYTRHSISELRAQMTFWMARVLQEDRARATQNARIRFQ